MSDSKELSRVVFSAFFSVQTWSMLDALGSSSGSVTGTSNRSYYIKLPESVTALPIAASSGSCASRTRSTSESKLYHGLDSSFLDWLRYARSSNATTAKRIPPRQCTHSATFPEKSASADVFMMILSDKLTANWTSDTQTRNSCTSVMSHPLDYTFI